MHSEWYEVPRGHAAGDRRARARAAAALVAVGTTTVRTLESAAARSRPGQRRHRHLHHAGLRFRVVDLLVTNFHLPKSTLLMLVSAFAGYENMMALYRHAIEQRYRFFSYGDAMLLARKTRPHDAPVRTAQDRGPARRGRLTLNHGVVETPIFMPVGTYGTVKGVMPRSLEEMGAQIILGNTFHLWLRPGLDVLQQFGGLHRFEQWNKPILTDSRRLPGLEPGRDAQDQRGGREVRLARQRRQAVPHARGLHADPDAC